MLDTPPKFTIFRYQKVKADPMSCSEGNCLVWRSGPLTIFGRPCAFGSFQKVKIGHLTTLTPGSLSSIFGLNSPRSNISLHASLIQALFISKFN